MRVLRLTVLVIAAVAVGGGTVACSQAIEGTGTIAADATAGPTSSPSSSGGSSPTSSPSPTETETSTPSPTPSPTADATTLRRRTLCVTERAAITTINSNFNKAKSREAQVSVLRTGARSITNQLAASRLPATDRIYSFGKAVLSQLNNLIRQADAGRSPSTTPYNQATTNFQKACASV